MAGKTDLKSRQSLRSNAPLLTTRLLKWMISATVILTVISLLVIVFPEKTPQNDQNGRNTESQLTALDRLQGRTSPNTTLPKTVGYTGIITSVNQDTLSLQLTNGTNVSVNISNSTVIERKVVSAQPEKESSSSLIHGRSVQVVADPLEKNPTIKVASKIILTN